MKECELAFLLKSDLRRITLFNNGEVTVLKQSVFRISVVSVIVF